MADPTLVDLYCEDRGHEQLARPLLQRLARQEGLSVAIRTQNSSGGHGRALSQFKLWQLAARGLDLADRPAMLVLMIDRNCSPWRRAWRELRKSVDATLFPHHVVGCPEPHVERWCLADGEAFRKVVGIDPPADPGKCDRGLYKRLLRGAILAAGHTILIDEMEFAPEIVGAMDFYRAGKAQPSFGHFIDNLQGALRRIGT
ncbi:MAG: DUF4276 family protein [Acidobacteria bacterium]|nr:MAG: DUF4276 family protein [Acidobacteriota bacterium]